VKLFSPYSKLKVSTFAYLVQDNITVVKGDIRSKLKDLSITENERKKIQCELLGRESGGRRVKGLVNGENEMEFKERRVDKEVQWPEQFKEWMVTTKGRHRSVKGTLKLRMLKPVRIATGLGNKWDHQRTGSLNILIKEAAENQVTDRLPFTKF